MSNQPPRQKRRRRPGLEIQQAANSTVTVFIVDGSQLTFNLNSQTSNEPGKDFTTSVHSGTPPQPTKPTQQTNCTTNGTAKVLIAHATDSKEKFDAMRRLCRSLTSEQAGDLEIIARDATSKRGGKKMGAK